MARVMGAAAAVMAVLAMSPGLAWAQGLPNSLQGLLGGNGVSRDEAVHQAYQQGFQDGFRQAQRQGGRSNERDEGQRRPDRDNGNNDDDQGRPDYQGRPANRGDNGEPR